MTNRQLSCCGAIAVLGFAALLAWRSCSTEARQLEKISLPPHTHTVTFTCSRTCTDMNLVPEVFPWK